MPVDGSTQKLVRYLNTPSPPYALLMRGEWGAGKSFFWRRFRESELSALNKRDITFSVAGLSTLEELERALFFASINDIGSGLLAETGTVVGRALLRWVKVEPEDIKLRADVRSDHTVVCIDDLERFSGNFKVLFGFVVSLIDDGRLHVVLIADEARAVSDLEGYGEYRERIISKSLEVVPQAANFYDSAVNGFVHESTRLALLDLKEHALKLFEEKGVKNLRTIRSILDALNEIMAAMQWPAGKSASLNRLLSAVTFYTVAVGKNAGMAGAVSRILLQGDVGIMFAMSVLDGDAEESTGGNGDRAEMAKLVREHGFGADVYSWPASAALVSYLTSGNCDPDVVARDFAIFDVPFEGSQSLLERFKSYRSMEEAEFQKAVLELQDNVKGGDFKTVKEVWTAYEILSHLSRLKLTGITEDECRELFVSSIDSYDFTSFIDGNLEFWPGDSHVADESVISALREIGSRIDAASKAEAAIAMQHAIVEGLGDEAVEVHLTPFAEADAEDIYGRLVNIGRPAAHRMATFFRRRLQVSNIATYVADELSFAESLADLIEFAVGPKQIVTLDESALLELGSVLRKFCLVVTRVP